MANSYWVEDVAKLVRQRMAESKVVMAKVFARPVVRRMNTSDAIAAHMADANAMPADVLAGYLRETYGDAANNLLPYLTGEDVQGDSGQIPPDQGIGLGL